RSVAALAAGVPAGLYGRARRRLAGGGARYSADHGSRFCISGSRPYSVRHVRGDRRHADRAGHRVVADRAVARPAPRCPRPALPRDAEDERRRERGAELKARLETLNVAESELERLAADGDTAPGVLALLRSRQDNRSRQVPKDAVGKEAIAAALALRAELINAE